MLTEKDSACVAPAMKAGDVNTSEAVARNRTSTPRPHLVLVDLGILALRIKRTVCSRD